MDKRILIAGGAIMFLLLVWVLLPKGKISKTGDAQISSSPASPSAKELYNEAVHYRKDRDLVKAKEMYQEILKNHPETENAAAVQEDLGKLNLELILSNTTVPDKTVNYEVVAGDVLAKIAKKFNTTVDLIKVRNNLKSDTIRLGQKLSIWTGTFNIIVDKSQNVLILKDGNDIVKVYNVSTGENNSTPVGKFKIISRLIDPVWFHRGIVVPPESPDNVLGTRWLGFDIPGYGIHGTVDPESIGKQVTAGCVRMRNEEIEELFNMIPMGTEVVIVD